MSSWSTTRRHFTDKFKTTTPYNSPTLTSDNPSPSLSEFTSKPSATNWFSIIPLDHFSSRPIKYLEIGNGDNVLSTVESYASHQDSTIVCIDLWQEEQNAYKTFLNNIEESGKENITVHRGYSHKIISTLENESFDIIYIDGSHEPECVLEDAVLSFRKLKTGGVMIFNGYYLDITRKCVDGFLSVYDKKINKLGLKEAQMFIQKK
jgi:precorrin-6B methylase 2